MSEFENTDGEDNSIANESRASKDQDLEKRLDRLEHYVSLIAEPAIRKNDPNRSGFERVADGLEASGFTRILVSLGAALAIFSFAGIAATAWGIRLQYQSMEEDKLSRAWQSLAMVGLGNAGKSAALQLIHERGEPLSGINIGGDSRLSSSEIPNLSLESARFQDSDWRNTSFEAMQLRDVLFGRMYLANSFLSGTFDNVEIFWSDANNSFLRVSSDSDILIDTSVFDNSSFFVFAGQELNGVASSTDLQVKEDGRVLLDTEETEKKELQAAGEVIRFSNVSLRCAFLPIEHAVNYRFSASNLSGAYLSGAYIGNPYAFPEEPETLVADVPKQEWEKFEGAWYFSDNPPVGVESEALKKHFVSLDRQKIKRQCETFETRANLPDPFSELDGADGIETACVSLAKEPGVCETRYPSQVLYSVLNSEDPAFNP
ncbi:MAG: hypothetical protein JJ866_10120 [Roseibium sp.]|uniref:hypothetical protein n=1 Tax=Roseibium sp. TaxID=1936156 RepID=UPI001B19496C|nr:hypothetical protein [Roseibium sp.]MBO6892283.1 hypothetical protein [Roseibium sp.]MBO6929892.1 hypothetical protein [Roseibium sp.]